MNKYVTFVKRTITSIDKLENHHKEAGTAGLLIYVGAQTLDGNLHSISRSAAGAALALISKEGFTPKTISAAVLSGVTGVLLSKNRFKATVRSVFALGLAVSVANSTNERKQPLPVLSV